MISVQITKDFDGIDVSLPRLKKLVGFVCKRFRLCEASVSVAIVDDRQFRRLNARFLNRKSTSDCLSFDLSEDDRRQFEVVVNGQLAVKQARSRGHSGEAESALYITHGLLHNLGFDDSTEQQAKRMHEMEDEILQDFGYGLVYSIPLRVVNVRE